MDCSKITVTIVRGLDISRVGQLTVLNESGRASSINVV